MELQDSTGRVVASQRHGNTGWAVAGRNMIQCSICGELRPPAWPDATICRYDWAGDFEKAWRQRGEKIRAAFMAEAR